MNFSLIKRTIKQTLYCIFLISTFSCAESVPDPHDNIIISKSFTAGEKIIFESDEKTIKSVSTVDRDNKFVYEKYPVYKENNVFTINRFLKILSKGHIAGILGADMSHIIADFVASYLYPHLRTMIIGIVVGGLIPLLLIPIFERFVVKSKHHIVTVDHEDVKKDLDSHWTNLLSIVK